MDWKNIATKIMTFAPALAGALLGPAGSVVTTAAVSILTSALGLSADATPEQVDALITDSPEIRVEIIKANQAFIIRQEEIALERFKTAVADIQDARGNVTDQVKATGKRDPNLYFLAWLTVIGFFVLAGTLLYFSYQGKPIQDSTGVLFMLFGALVAKFGTVYDFFFGSSSGSQSKDERLANSTPLKPCV